MNRFTRMFAGLFTVVVAVGAHGVRGGEHSVGPDVIYSDINSIRDYGAIGGVHGYALGSNTCNIGNQNLLWVNDGTPGLGMNAYRLHDNRLEQIGISWVKTACCAAAGAGCGLACNGQGGNVLGAGCLDVYSGGFNGIQSNMAARSSINAFTGQFSGLQGGNGDALFRRLQIVESDLADANFPGAQYFAEGVYAAVDDAQADNSMNNASYKRVTISGTFALQQQGPMNVGIPAIFAWRDHGNGPNTPDTSVEIIPVDVPGEGRFFAATRVSDNGNGTWRYAYAIFNLNSDRSGGSLSVPVPESVNVTNVGFHDVDYHSGEVYDNTDWVVSTSGGVVRWSSPQTFDENANSNAIRWGTMYTFWFDADAPPADVDATLGLFKPFMPESVDFPSQAPANLCPAPAFLGGATGIAAATRVYDGFIDARQESTDGVNVDLGLSSFIIEVNTEVENVNGTPISASAFTVTDTAGSAPTVVSVSSEDQRRITIELSEAITVDAWTDITLNARSLCSASVMNETLRVGFLPADVNQDGSVTPFDLLRLRQHILGLITPEAGVPTDFADLNRNGSIEPIDLLIFRQLLNGVPPATRAWAGESLP